MRVDVIRDRSGLEALAGEWNRLLARSRADNVFLTWEFISAWVDVARPGCKLCVLAVRDSQGALVGIAPFHRHRLKLAGVVEYHCLRVLGDAGGAADYPDLIVQADRELEVLRALGRHMAAMPGWDCLWLGRAAGWTGTVERLRELADGGDFHLRLRSRCFSVIHLPATFDAYLETLSSNTRYNLRRGRRQCEDLGGCKLRTCETPEQVAAFVGELERLHQKHWESVGDLGGFRREPRLRAFFEEVSRRFVQRGWLRLSGLEIQGRMQAVQFGYAYGGSYYSIQEGYDPDLTGIRGGVGSVARAAAIESAIAEGIRTYDFLADANPHKQRWGARMREGHDIFVLRRSLKTRPLRALSIWPTGRYMFWDSS